MINTAIPAALVKLVDTYKEASALDADDITVGLTTISFISGSDQLGPWEDINVEYFADRSPANPTGQALIWEITDGEGNLHIVTVGYRSTPQLPEGDTLGRWDIDDIHTASNAFWDHLDKSAAPPRILNRDATTLEEELFGDHNHDTKETGDQ